MDTSWVIFCTMYVASKRSAAPTAEPITVSGAISHTSTSRKPSAQPPAPPTRYRTTVHGPSGQRLPHALRPGPACKPSPARNNLPRAGRLNPLHGARTTARVDCLLSESHRNTRFEQRWLTVVPSTCNHFWTPPSVASILWTTTPLVCLWRRFCAHRSDRCSKTPFFLQV